MKPKTIFLIIILLLIWTWPSGGILPKPKVDPANFIFEPDSLAVATLINMVETTPSPDVNPDPVVDKCNCSRGKVSYDGGTSFTDCPCSLGGGKCQCKDCPYNKGKGS